MFIIISSTLLLTYVMYLQKATGGNGVNIILEMLANVNLGKDLKLLSKNGRVMVGYVLIFACLEEL